MLSIWEGTDVAAFLQEQWASPEARKMFQLGQIAVKVAGMFQLQPTDTPPAEACKAAAAWLIGMESGDAAVYADCDAEALRQHGPWVRSEEHTSELQSLMRISYAVFCLKQNNKTKSLLRSH